MVTTNKTLLLAVAALLCVGCSKSDEMKLKEIIERTEAAYAPLSKAANIAYWNGTTNGDTAEFGKYSELNMRITALFSDAETFADLKSLKERGEVKDSLLSRQLDELYSAFLSCQGDKALLDKITLKETELEQKYAAFRAEFRGTKINDNLVEMILHESTDSKELQDVWEAHKAIGRVVADDIIEVVKLRNEKARSLGFENYQRMSLALSGLEPDECDALMDEVDVMTRDGFTALKKEMDAKFAARYGVRVDKLMPWHYQGRFFQEAPNLYPVDLDKYYKGRNLEELVKNYYAGIGLDVTSILAASDLYPREGKNQHAYCTDIDREGDVRSLCNLSDNEQWMGTILHEFGHGVYSKGHDASGLPYFLRDAAHSFTTEAVAMLFGRMSRNPEWMERNLGISAGERASIENDCMRSSRLQQLVFCRWTQVVYRFEKAMYADPDQDLNKLWWDLVEEYQMLHRPEGRDEPDWATKIHIALYPCYYQNYQMGELFASQMHHYIVANITKSGDYANDCYQGNKEVGKWLTENVFAPGKLYPWNEMIRRATGEPLTAKYYKQQFVD